MPSSEWNIPSIVQPNPADYSFDLDRALASVVGLTATVPEDAFTAEVLGTERAGNGVVIREDGVVLTVGYLITEADSLWLRLHDGRSVPGHALGYDQETGFGLVQALGRLELPSLPLGDSAAARLGERTVVGGAGGRERSVAGRIVAKQEFAGYWEYVLDEAIFTAPAHPHWGGTALIGNTGELLGIGSLLLEQSSDGGRSEHLNMVIPIDLLKPVFQDLLTIGRPNRPPRPWLGLYATEMQDHVVVVGLANGGPAQDAGVRTGDLVLAIGDEEVQSLAGLFRRVWSLGGAGAEVPLRLFRDGRILDLHIVSADRNRFLKGPSLH